MTKLMSVLVLGLIATASVPAAHAEFSAGVFPMGHSRCYDLYADWLNRADPVGAFAVSAITRGRQNCGAVSGLSHTRHAVKAALQMCRNGQVKALRHSCYLYDLR
jgi:hypothetical protein